jgi:hypothetical protein
VVLYSLAQIIVARRTQLLCDDIISSGTLKPCCNLYYLQKCELSYNVLGMTLNCTHTEGKFTDTTKALVKAITYYMSK